MNKNTSSLKKNARGKISYILPEKYIRGKTICSHQTRNAHFALLPSTFLFSITAHAAAARRPSIKRTQKALFLLFFSPPLPSEDRRGRLSTARFPTQKSQLPYPPQPVVGSREEREKERRPNHHFPFATLLEAPPSLSPSPPEQQCSLSSSSKGSSLFSLFQGHIGRMAALRSVLLHKLPWAGEGSQAATLLMREPTAKKGSLQPAVTTTNWKMAKRW